MQNVSPGMGDEGAGRDVADEYNVGNHVTVPGIVNVEQNRFAPGDLSDIGCKAIAGTGQPPHLSENGGAAS